MHSSDEDPSPSTPSRPLAEDEDAPHAAADNQAELVQWHYRLGHLPFPKLKQLLGCTLLFVLLLQLDLDSHSNLCITIRVIQRITDW